MAITFAKLKPAHQVQADQVHQAIHKPKLMLVAQSTTEALADELINITQKLQELDVASMTTRVDEIKKELQSLAVSTPPDEPLVIKGVLGTVELSPCASSVKVADMEGLLNYADNKLGHEAMLSIVKVTLTDLKKVLSEQEIGKFTVKVAGSRSCKVKAIHPAAA